MTRWQKFGWALGYSAMFIFTPLAWLLFRVNALLILPGSSVFVGVLFAGLSEIPALEAVTSVTLAAVMAGLVIAPVCALFQRYWPLHGLMALDVALHALLIAHALLEEDSLATLDWLIPGIVLSITLLAVAAYLFCRPEKEEKSAATPCKSAAALDS